MKSKGFGVVLASHQFGSDACISGWKGQARFALTSFVGRTFAKKTIKSEFPLIQIGSGTNPLPGFENIDFYFDKRTTHGHDLRYPLPFADNSFEGGFSEHTLEHLPPFYALKLLSEMHRVLKPGAIFRCVVPDLGKYIRYYNGEVPNQEFNQYSSGCEAIWCLTQNWFHQSVWDEHMLSQKLLEAGFSSTKGAKFMEGDDPRLLVDLQERAWESLYVEARK